MTATRGCGVDELIGTFYCEGSWLRTQIGATYVTMHI
jgi:hypothetical protein